MINPKKILILAPHTDDGELGCGGTIAKFCSMGKEVYYAAFSLCAASLPAGIPADTLAKECKKATGILGINPAHVLLLEYEVRHFPVKRQPILEELVKLNSSLNPDLVFVPSGSDIHQDHGVIHTEALRAFKHCSLLGYELPWNQSGFQATYFSTLSPDNVLSKIAALKAYESQAHRNYMQEDFIASLAKVRGVQANVPFAEAFEVYRLIS